MSGDWLATDRADLAAERILDAAAQLFAERGVAAVGMRDIATAAGCSRATLYRYFDNRQAVRVAFVHRETRRIVAGLGPRVAGIADPGERIIAAMLGAVAAVRADPLLIAWFRPDDSGTAGRISQDSDVIESLAVTIFADIDLSDPERGRLARWLTRIIVSLLATPGRDDADERAMLEQFVAPVIPRAFV
ncbi:TetR/AcrR family transcriptional regulator [Nocardia asteroides]|uniref:TetR family transcriptional regulator n=1 Tax=Nocardia asteroides NBRC 15531 TaxID=1110697 RepID=U5E9I9_NOCAS|nr:TetR/AcrR family transcriptional regulator [Nocardia asteroides]TLF69925.1 TetR/AcrR family transcriptional regulator [Nocardia asteroides NBRC 15531]UGT49436.1 TetR/AcrR family transcriptional regulator [Nocardia asteroides]SFL90419.1 transcriptional regulator, TetR family [Nocardia asteroides]VEG38033.1 HTH-type transcriptional repressor KstR2 [Nocardia asteroides]GAD84035.1 putative TetR family transcriptional regulator [Nocardia asteroides NBRC 15531]